MLIDNEHQEKMERMKNEDTIHHRNSVLLKWIISILAGVIVFAMCIDQADTALSLLNTILIAFGGAGLAQALARR